MWFTVVCTAREERQKGSVVLKTVEGLSECGSLWSVPLEVCLFVGCLTSQQHASASQGRICTDNFA